MSRTRIVRSVGFCLVLFFILFAGLFSSCSRKLSDDKEESVAVWNNPELGYTHQARARLYRSHPFDKSLSDRERLDSAGFFDFIANRNTYFEQSNLSLREADSVYSALFHSDITAIFMESVISPSESNDELVLKRIKEKVALKKTSPGQGYEVFMKFYDCGWNFSYRQIHVDQETFSITNIEELETWVARMPC